MNITPRTNALDVHIRTRHEYQKTDHQLWREHSDQLEIELNAAKQVALNFMREAKSLNNSLVAANERIKRLEEILFAFENAKTQCVFGTHPMS